MLNILTPKEDSLKQKRTAAAFEYYKTRGGSNSVDEWKNNAHAYSLEKVLTNNVGLSDLEQKISERLQEELGVRGNLMVPLSQFATRSDLSAGTAAVGGNLIQSTVESDFFSGYL